MCVQWLFKRDKLFFFCFVFNYFIETEYKNLAQKKNKYKVDNFLF